jgi:hypothetical protein
MRKAIEGKQLNIVRVDIGGTFTDLVGCVDGRVTSGSRARCPTGRDVR